MKQLFLTGAVFLALTINAQKEFTQEWKSVFPVDAKWKMLSYDRKLVLGGDMSEIAMLDGLSGKVLWTMKFKDKLGKKPIDWGYDKDHATVWVKLKGENKGEEKTLYYEDTSGKEIDQATYQIKKAEPVKSSSFLKWTEYKTSVDADGNHISIDYVKKLVTGAAKAKKTTATVYCTGANNWKQDINIQVVRSLISNASETYGGPSIGSGDFLDVFVSGDKVFVLYEGLSVLDIKTGKLLWETTFDNSIFDFGVFKSTQELGRAAWPLATKDAVYVVDLSEKNRCIRKLNIETGAEIWRGEQLPKDAIVPGLQLVGNTLVAQFGGKIEKQSYIPGTNGRPDVYKREFRYDGDYGVKAYDASSGKLLWQTEGRKELNDKFSGRITNITADDKNVYVASSKNVYSFEAQSGKVQYAVPVENLKTGDPERVWFYNNNLIVECEEGIASIAKEGGKVNYGTNTKKCLSSFAVANAFFVWVGKNEEDFCNFIRFDLDNGSVLGKIEDTRYPYFSGDAESFIKFDDNKVMRYKTR